MKIRYYVIFAVIGIVALFPAISIVFYGAIPVGINTRYFENCKNCELYGCAENEIYDHGICMTPETKKKAESVGEIDESESKQMSVDSWDELLSLPREKALEELQKKYDLNHKFFMNMTIIGLQDSYNIDQVPQFTVIQAGYGIPCNEPRVIISQDGNEKPYWDYRLVYPCPFSKDGYPILSYMMIPDNNRILPPITESGQYTVTAYSSYDSTVSKQFTVQASDFVNDSESLKSELESQFAQEPLEDKVTMIKISQWNILNDYVIKITGWTNQTQYITSTITAPNGAVISTGKIFPMSNGTFTDFIVTFGPLWKQQDGIYLVTVQQGNDPTDSAYFELDLKDGNIVAVK